MCLAKIKVISDSIVRLISRKSLDSTGNRNWIPLNELRWDISEDKRGRVLVQQHVCTISGHKKWFPVKEVSASSDS